MSEYKQGVCSSTPRVKPSWSTYFMGIVDAVKRRSPDPRTQVGAVLTTHDNRIISTGYNALKAGMDESRLDWSDRESVYARIIHAESNALLYAQSRFENSRLYCSYSPCRECLKLMAAAGVTRIVFEHAYKDFLEVKSLADELKIELLQWIPEVSV